jgi:hypothetical protein
VLISPYPDHEGNKLQRPNSNFCKPLKNNSKFVRPTSSSRRQWPPRRTKNGDLSIVFLSRVGLRTYQHPCILHLRNNNIIWTFKTTNIYHSQILGLFKHLIQSVNQMTWIQNIWLAYKYHVVGEALQKARYRHFAIPKSRLALVSLIFSEPKCQ